MNHLQIQHPSLPIALVCNLNGMVALIPTQKFKAFVEHSEGLQSIFDNTGYSINNIDYEYGSWYNYKSDEGLLKWLKMQNLSMPDLEGMFRSPFGF